MYDKIQFYFKVKVVSNPLNGIPLKASPQVLPFNGLWLINSSYSIIEMHSSQSCWNVGGIYKVSLFEVVPLELFVVPLAFNPLHANKETTKRESEEEFKYPPFSRCFYSPVHFSI